MKKILLLLLISGIASAQFTPFPPTPVAPGTLIQKGDVLTHDGAVDFILNIGVDGQTLQADSASTGGMKWDNPKASGSRLNLVEFPSFENGQVTEGACVNCTAISETTEVLKTTNNLESLKIESSAAVATYIVDKATDAQWHTGMGILKKIWIKTIATDVKIISRVDGVDENVEFTVSSGGEWKLYNVPTLSGTTSNGYKIDIPTSGSIVYIDETSIAPNTETAVVTTVNYGLVRGAGNSGLTITANTENVDFTTVQDDGGLWTNVSGNGNDTYTADGPGNHSISGSIAFTANQTLTIETYINGVLDKRMSAVVDNRSHGVFSGSIFLNEGDTLNIRIDNTAVLRDDLEPTVRHWINIQNITPLEETNTIVSQNTEVPYVVAADNNDENVTLNTEDIPFILVESNSASTCGWDGVKYKVCEDGTYIVTGSVRFTTTSALVWLYLNGVRKLTISNSRASTTTKPFVGIVKALKGDLISIRTNITLDVVSGAVDAHNLHIQKLLDDATILGKFANINTTALCQVYAVDNSGGIPTANTEDIPFKTIQKDNCGAWTNAGNSGANTSDSYLAQKTGRIEIDGGMFFGASATRGLELYIDGTLKQRCGRTEASQGGVFSCQLDVVVGELITMRNTSSLALSSSIASHWIAITELPDTASIIANAMDSVNKTECQTKILSADVTNTFGTMAELTFNNLDIAKRYKITGQVSLRANDGGSASVQILNNGKTLSYPEYNGTASNTGIVTSGVSTGSFSITSNTITFYARAESTGRFVRGSGTKSQTYFELCELPSTTIETTKFN